MKYYMEIKIMPDEPEVSQAFVADRVFNILHGAMAAAGRGRVGVGLPDLVSQGKDMGLGGRIRLFSNEKTILENLYIEKALDRYEDYTLVGDILETPHCAIHAVYRRRQAKSQSRLAKRKARRESLPEKKVASEWKRGRERRLRLPFVTVRSGTNSMKIHIEKTHYTAPVEGEFSSYGLSATATVPEF